MQYIALMLKICELCGVNFPRPTESAAKICSGCERQLNETAQAKEMHLVRKPATAASPKPPHIPMRNLTCAEPGCDRPARSVDRCYSHYAAHRRLQATASGICSACFKYAIAPHSKSRCIQCYDEARKSTAQYRAIRS